MATGHDNDHIELPEKKAKQGGFGRIVLWVLIASLALAVIVGAILLSNTEVFADSDLLEHRTEKGVAVFR